MGKVDGGPLLLAISGPAGTGKSTVGGLVAAEFDSSVQISGDDFARFIARGWVEQWRPEAAHQNEVIGVALAVAAMQFAEGDYTVVVDGHFFPDGFEDLAQACAARRIRAHYAILRADLATCRMRAEARGPVPEASLFDALHARFEELGAYEANVVDAERAPDAVAADLLRRLRAGELRPRLSSRSSRPG